VTNEELKAEVARLEAELAAARLAHHCSEGVLSMTVHRLGGMVEGHPTQRINFLQRIDELVAMENERHVPLTGSLAQRVETIVQDAAKRIANHIHSYERRKVTIREAVHAALAESKETAQ
jgi:hypothetical protein